MPTGVIVAFCGILIAASAISIDSTLPLFPEMVAEFGSGYATVQMTVTVYILTAGLAQLFWGPLSDGYGRRPVLIAGLVVYLVGCLISALAPNVELLLAGRALQGIGGAAAIVIGRTILRDLFSGETLARHMAMATAVFAAGPIVAPFLGAGFAYFAGWRGVYGLLALLAAAAIAMTIRLPETVPGRVERPLAPGPMLARLGRLLRHPQSRYFLILAGLVMATMTFIIASVPRIYDEQFGLVGMAFATYFAVHGFGIIVGQFANRRLIGTIGIVGAMRVGNAVLIVAAALLLVTALAGVASPLVWTLIFVLYATSLLVVMSNSTALVLDPHGDIAGFAASVFGVVSQVGAAVIASLLVWLTGGEPALFAAALLAVCVVCFAMLIIWPAGKAGGPH